MNLKLQPIEKSKTARLDQTRKFFMASKFRQILVAMKNKGTINEDKYNFFRDLYLYGFQVDFDLKSDDEEIWINIDHTFSFQNPDNEIHF